MNTRIRKKGNTVTVLSDQTYTKNKEKLLRVKDNGNGFTVKYYSWSSCNPDLYWSIPYDAASDLMDALELFDFREEPDEERTTHGGNIL